MKVLAIFVLLMGLATFASAKSDEPRLQIGVKKRIENCMQKARKGDTVHVHYRGTLKNGEEFDSSIPRGTPFSFVLGSGQVIKGWDQGLLGMCVGEKRRLVIPPELGYGKSGSGGKIPPNSVLIFEVEMIKIDGQQEL